MNSPPIITAPNTLPRPRSSLHRGDEWAGALCALPHLLLFAVFVLFPIVCGFYISLHQWHVLAKQHPFVGVANYRAALGDDIFWMALRNTVLFVVLVVPLG